jgi:lipopolysaccharide exporter
MRTDKPIDRKAVFRGGLLAIALAWSVRLIGLVSVVALARLLTPADFGVIAVAMTAVAFVELFGSIGLRQALLRIKAPERDHYDTAWTLQLLIFSAMGLVMLGVAPLAADFYDQPALTPVLMVISLRFLCLALINIGIVDFERHMEFGRDLRMRVAARLGSLVITLTAAVLLRNYWALVIGLVSQTALLTVASFVAHPFRPRLSLARRAELLGVSLWLFISSTAAVIQQQIERLVVGRFATASVVGFYSVSKDLSEMFTNEIATALNRVTFVTVARAEQPLSDSPELIRKALGAYAMIAAPLAAGMAVTAYDMVYVLLGAKWLAATPLLEIVAIYSGLYAIFRLIMSVLQASGHERAAAAMTGGGALLSIVAISYAAWTDPDAMTVAYAALGVNIAMLVVGILILGRIGRLGVIGLVSNIVRPFLAAGLMVFAVRLVTDATGSPYTDFLVSVLVGAASYALALLLIWLVAGRPTGAETEAGLFLKGLRR